MPRRRHVLAAAGARDAARQVALCAAALAGVIELGHKSSGTVIQDAVDDYAERHPGPGDLLAVIEVADVLRPADFYRQANGTIYRAMLDLWERREPIDIITVAEALERSGDLSVQAAREPDQSLGVACEVLVIGARLVVEPVEVRVGDELQGAVPSLSGLWRPGAPRRQLTNVGSTAYRELSVELK